MKFANHVCVLLISFMTAGVPAQVTVSASKLTDGDTKANGLISFQLTLADGQPASIVLPGGGVTTVAPVSANVVDGAFTISLQDVTLTNPPLLCYSVTLSTRKSSALGPGYTCIQPHGTSTDPSDWCTTSGCNFDLLAPSLPATNLAQTFGPLSMETMWNNIVSAWIATPGNTVLVQSAIDTPTVIVNLNNALLSATTLPFYNTSTYQWDQLTARTINVTGLVPGARFLLIINPIDSAPNSTPQTVTFGTGCVWSFGPGGVTVTNNTLTFGAWEGASYLAYFMYDGTNCIGMVTH